MDEDHYEDLLLIKRAIKSIYDEESSQFHANIQRWGTHLLTFIYLIVWFICNSFVVLILQTFYWFIYFHNCQTNGAAYPPTWNFRRIHPRILIPYMNFRWLLLCLLLVGIVWICWVRHLWSTCRTFDNRLQTKQCYCFGTAVGKGCFILQIYIHAHTYHGTDKGMHDGSERKLWNYFFSNRSSHALWFVNSARFLNWENRWNKNNIIKRIYHLILCGCDSTPHNHRIIIPWKITIMQ